MLTDVQCKNAKPGIHWKTGKPVLNKKGEPGDYKMADAHGLYLLVTAKGGKRWCYKFYVATVNGRKEKKGSLGTYPEISLAQARIDHGTAKGDIRQGDDPIQTKRKKIATKAVAREKNRPFRDVAKEWLDDLIEPNYTAIKTLRRYRYHVKVLSKAFGNVLIGDVRLDHLTGVLLKFQREKKHESRRRIQVSALSIIEMARTRGYIEINYFAGISFQKGYTAPGTTHKPRPAITDPVGFGRLLGDIDQMPDRVDAAFRLLALTFVRPGELLQLKWREHVIWKEAKLIVPFEILKERTKRKGTEADGRDLEVPLSRQALAELRALQKRTGNHVHLFPAMQEDSKVLHMRGYILNRALNRAEYQGIHCPHGFRSSASTMLNAERQTIDGKKVLVWPDQKALIELQLDHQDPSVQAIYDRGGRWEERRELMQLWADRIDEMRANRTALKLAA